MATKKQNQRDSRKKAVSIKKPIDEETPYAKRDSSRAARRMWGSGKSK